MNELDRRNPFWTYGDVALFVGLAAAAFFLIAVATAAIVHIFHATGSMLVQLVPGQILLYGFVLLFLYLLLRINYGQPFWASLAWVRTPINELYLAGLGLLLALGIGALSVVLRTPDLDTPMKRLFSEPLAIVLVGAMGITIGPLVEELVFRGFLQPLLVRSLGVFPGIAVTALAFGGLHLPEYSFSWRHGVLITMTGIAFGWMRHKSGSTRASTIMHAGYNLTFFIALVAQKR